jgi:hypothetical protein
MPRYSFNVMFSGELSAPTLEDALDLISECIDVPAICELQNLDSQVIEIQRGTLLRDIEYPDAQLQLFGSPEMAVAQ